MAKTGTVVLNYISQPDCSLYANGKKLGWYLRPTVSRSNDKWRPEWIVSATDRKGQKAISMVVVSLRSAQNLAQSIEDVFVEIY